MYTKCPNCSTLFRIHQAQIDAAKGQVRCGQCNHVFNANDHLQDPAETVELETLVNTPETESSTEDANAGVRFQLSPDQDKDPNYIYIPNPNIQPHSNTHHETDDLGSEFDIDEFEADILQDDGPEIGTSEYSSSLFENDHDQSLFLDDEKPRSFGWFWGICSLILIAVLIGQTTWWLREQAVWHSGSRLVLEQICAVAKCDVPQRKAADQIRILDRDIRSNMNAKDALLLELTMSNTAGFKQPFPVIQLSLYDTSEKLVAQRRFNPEEYLATSQQQTQLMPMDLPVHIEMELNDPGSTVTGFRFDFF